MKQTRLLTLLLIFTLLVAFSSMAFADTKVVKIVVPELCASNMMDAQSLIDSIGGITASEMDVENLFVVLTFSDDKTSLEEIKKAFKGISLPVESSEEVKK